MLRAAVALADDAGIDVAQHAQTRPGARRRADGALQARGQQGRTARRHGRRRRRRDRSAGPRRRLEARGPAADPLGAAGAAAPPLGVAGDRVADHADPGRAGLHGLDDRHVPRAGGFSVDLTHHVMHAMGSRILGFSQELFDDSAAGRSGPPTAAAAPLPRGWPRRYPYVAEIAMAAAHDDDSVVGRAATTSSSSSSRWTCCWTASNGCVSRAGRHRADRLRSSRRSRRVASRHARIDPTGDPKKRSRGSPSLFPARTISCLPQHIADGGTCRKTRVTPQNRQPRSPPAEMHRDGAPATESPAEGETMSTYPTTYSRPLARPVAAIRRCPPARAVSR